MIASEELLKDIIYFHVYLFQPVFSDCHSKISVCIKASVKLSQCLQNKTERMPDSFKWNKYFHRGLEKLLKIGKYIS